MKQILLIEDNTAVRENTAELLELADYKMLVAANGKDGVGVFCHQHELKFRLLPHHHRDDVYC